MPVDPQALAAVMSRMQPAGVPQNGPPPAMRPPPQPVTMQGTVMMQPQAGPPQPTMAPPPGGPGAAPAQPGQPGIPPGGGMPPPGGPRTF